MRTTIFLLLMIVHLSSFSQKINYSIPKGYETAISKEDFKNIVDLAVPVVAKRYTIDEVREGTIYLKPGQEMQAVNLHNLIGKCTSAKDKKYWKDIIEGHFESIFSSIDEQKKINVEEYESVKKYLALRIYPVETITQRGGTSSVVAKTQLEGTYTLLMLDLPGMFTPVSRDIFSLWKRDTAEVFKAAQENVNRQPIEKVTKTFDIDGAKIEISFLGNEDYAASFALDLMNNSPELVGEWGAAVAIPNKGLVDICKISRDKPVDFVKFIQRMKPRVENSYQAHEQPISDQFFWYYKGTFTTIRVTQLPDGSISVLSPFGLAELMTEKK